MFMMLGPVRRWVRPRIERRLDGFVRKVWNRISLMTGTKCHTFLLSFLFSFLSLREKRHRLFQSSDSIF